MALRAAKTVNSGSSPRVRSGPLRPSLKLRVAGIISACAERTTVKSTPPSTDGDHLRVCGADHMVWTSGLLAAGSSPRVRSGRVGRKHIGLDVGIISACAERTNTGRAPKPSDREHLRVCGADRTLGGTTRWIDGSSPRVRSGRSAMARWKDMSGIISACAERTLPSPERSPPRPDHLRVCGADGMIAASCCRIAGSSPRVRSGLGRVPEARGRIGIISACAERTQRQSDVRRTHRDHLRVCGADIPGSH